METLRLWAAVIVLFLAQTCPATAASLYVSNERSGQVSYYDLTTGALQGTVGIYTTPTGLALDPAGNLYVVAFGEGRIHKINLATGARTVFVTVGVEEGVFALAFDPEGNAYVSLQITGQVRKYTPGGTLVGSVAVPRPRGISFNPVTGRLYVTATPFSDLGQGQGDFVYSVTTNLIATPFVTNLDSPRYTAADASGGVLVSTGNPVGPIVLFGTPQGPVVQDVQGGNQIAMTSGGFPLYVSQYYANNVLRCTAPGSCSVFASQLVGSSGTHGVLIAPTLLGCEYSLNPASLSLGPAAGSGSFNVVTGAGCSWSAGTNDNWVFLASGSGGTGNGTVGFNVSANSGAARTGTITAANRTFTVTQGAACTYSLSPSSRLLAAAGGEASFTLSTQPDCGWSITAGAAWVTIVGTPPGMGPATISYRVAPNLGAARTTTITTGSQTFTIQQEAFQPCTVALTPGATLFGPAGGQGSFQVIALCAFSAVSESPWIQILSGATGQGSGTVTYRVDALTGSSRTGFLSVNGTRFAVSQNDVPCTLSVTPASLNVPAGGGTASVFVSNPQSCAWTANSSVPWVTVTGGANGSLTGTVAFLIQPNAGEARGGFLTVAGRAVMLTQPAGTNCAATLTPGGATYLSPGGRGVLEVASACAWTAVSQASWIRVTSGASGSGQGGVGFSVDPFPVAGTRIGNLTVAGQSFVITQQGPACLFSLSSASLASPSAGQDFSIMVGAPAGCAWTASTVLPWVSILSGVSGSGNGTVNLRVLPQTGNAPRSGVVTVAQRPVVVLQAGADTFSCTSEVVGSPAQVRAEGMAELTSDLLLRCGGSAARAFRGNVLVRLNTSVTSRGRSPFNSAVDSLLLIGNPSTLVPGENVFLGVLVGGNALQFSGIPLASAGSNPPRTYRITNLRADATVPGLGVDVTAAVEVVGDLEAVPVRPAAPQLVIARSTPALHTTLGAASGTGDITLPVTFREAFSNAFRIRLAAGQDPSQIGSVYASESGFVNTAALGPETGLANSATRLLVRFRGIPAGVRIFAPTSISPGASAQLITTDPFGASLGGVVGGSQQEVTVVAGEAALTWEITAANPGSIETLTFPVVFRNTTLAVVQQIRGTTSATLGPLPLGPDAGVFALQPVPRFADPAVARRRPNTRVKGSVEAVSAAALRSAALRAPTGNRTVVLPLETTNESEETATDVIVRGNLSAGSSFLSGECDAGRVGASCAVEGTSLTLRYPRLEPGEQVKALANADLRFDAPNGSFFRLSVGGVSDFNYANDTVETCLPAISQVPPPSGDGATGSLAIWGCEAWRIDTTVPWIRFNIVGGYGNAVVQYTVDANATGAARTGTITLTGGTVITVEQPRAGGGSPSGLRFVPVTPCRLLETRPVYAGATWTGPYGPPILTAGQSRTLPVAGGARCGIPATAKAFVLNVTLDTVENGTGPVDFVTVYPTGQPRPNFWTARTTTGGYIANSAIVAAGANGSVDIYTSHNVNMVMDINGYFTDDAAAPGLLFYPHGPCRGVDTRGAPYGTMAPPYGNSRMQAGETRAFRLPGSPGCAGLPAAPAYSLQMTLAPGAETNGNPVAFVTAWPNGQPQPPISNMNAYFGYAVANSGIVPANSTGTMSVFSYNATNVILDVNGYFAADDGTGRGLYYYPVVQCRALNTTDGTLSGAYGGPQLTAAADRQVPLAGSPRCTGVPSTAKAFALNATAIPNGAGMPFLSMWPAGAAWPVVSQLNAFQGQTVSNSGIVPAGPNGTIQVKVAGTTHVAIEVTGYFSR